MIVVWLLTAISTVGQGVINALPSLDPPAWLTDVSGPLQGILDAASGMGVWVPMQLAITVAGAVLACLVVGFGIKITRIVLSFITLGGGSAG